jgi:hypothetical protein
MPGIERAAAQLGINVNFAPMFGCPSLKGITKVSRDYINERCLEFNKRVFQLITEEKVTHVVLFSAFNRYFRDGSAGYGRRPNCVEHITCVTEFGEALIDTANYLQKNNVKVYFVEQPPEFEMDGDGNISKVALFNGVNSISLNRQTYEGQSKLFLTTIGGNFPVLSFNEFFCTGALCRPSLNGHMLYINGDHFGNFGALALTSQWIDHLVNLDLNP